MKAEDAVCYVELNQLHVFGAPKPGFQGKGTPTAKARYYWVVGEPQSGGVRGTGLTLADAVEHFIECKASEPADDDADIM